jgi:hypothetical protein
MYSRGSVGLPIASTEEHAKTKALTRPEEKKYREFARSF